MASIFDESRRWILISCLGAYFLSMAMIYQMSPFFQIYAKDTTGADEATVGVIFAVMPSACFIGNLGMDRMISRLGVEMTLNVGLAMLAFSSLGFGFAGTVRGWLFWRALQGLATAPIYTSISTRLARSFTGHGEFHQVVGIQEMLGNAGVTIAPLLGGVLFSWGGFKLPFILSAVMHLLFLGITLCSRDPDTSESQPLLEGQQGETEAEATASSVASLPVMLLNVVPLVCLGVFGGYEPILGSRFRDVLGPIHPATVGFLMSMSGVPSTFFTFFVPALVERIGSRMLMTLGLLLYALGTFCFGLPPGATGSTMNWTAQLAALMLIGTGWALCWTPALPCMVDSAVLRMVKDTGASAEVARHKVSPAVSTLFCASAALGEASNAGLSEGPRPHVGHRAPGVERLYSCQYLLCCGHHGLCACHAQRHA
ncbi:unnamed protein product [Symbiodinium pilosum]|uniref:Major facilitator superfamily (MFS) profile domain-containing protein n=1 Tax=Symbiodinium pilosum TaxID=2952 RepID=A0A812SLB5_SYMPI|nr:unnamed protein product [Symbiodinium pilosum]